MSDHGELEEIAFVKIEPICMIEEDEQSFDIEDVHSLDLGKVRSDIVNSQNRNRFATGEDVDIASDINSGDCSFITSKQILNNEATDYKRDSKKINGSSESKNSNRKLCKTKKAQKSSNDILEKNASVEVNIKAKILTCSVCSTQFSDLSTLKNHTHEDFKASCLICSKLIPDPQELQCHLKEHFNERNFVCPSCGKTFRRAANFIRHESNCGKEKLSFDKLCTICGKVCLTRWQLKQHMVFHSDDRPFPCVYCPKKFRFKVRLREHERTHLGIKPHTCSACKKCFTTSSDLKKHEKRHAKPGFKAYNTENNPNKLSTCKVCSEKVVNLKNHMKPHYAEMSMKDSDTCSICGKIVRAASLYQHMKIHLEGSVYKCDICNRNFNRKDNMLSHKERHSKPGYKPNLSARKMES